MLHISPEVVLAGRRMAGFEEILERLRRQREEAQQVVAKLTTAIGLMEKARDALGTDEAVRLWEKTIASPPTVETKERQRVRGVLSPDEIARIVREILLEAGHPMKRGELVGELEKRQIPLAGTNKNKNLGTMLWRHKSQFVSLDKLGYWVRDVPLTGVYEPEKS